MGEACDPADECGVLRCFADQDGKTLGVGISFAGNPDAIDVDCTDEDGNSLYVNGIRKVRNDDGTCSLGTLPIPLQGKTCVESGGQCTTQFPPGEEGSSYGSDADGGCGPAPCTEITNQSCYPMIVTPKVTITDARIGPGVTYQIQPNIQGNFGAAIDVFSNTQGGCTATAAGTGDTTSGGDPAHTHEGPSHTHTIDCAGGPETYSGTIDQPIVQIAPGETFKFCANASIKYERTVQDAGELNFGQVTACLEYTSLVTPETIAALEGSTS